MLNKKVYLASALLGIFASSTAFATNGYFAHGYSSKEKGLAGAGVAHSRDALASATNPAGLTQVGERLDVGLAAFAPKRSYTVTGNPSCGSPCFPLSAETVESDNELFAIPHIGYTANAFGGVVGIAAYGNGGMNSEYKNATHPSAGTGTFAGGTAGVDLMQLFINATYARQLNSTNSVGISAVAAVQSFEAKGLGAFGMGGMSVDANSLTNNDHDVSYGVGAKVGWQGQVTDVLTLGASYQSEIGMTKFDDYSGLFAQGGSFDIPATATVGLAWKTSPATTLVLDVQEIYYSDVPALNNGIGNLQGFMDGSGRLGGANGAGFGWDDMRVVKVGYEWGSNTTWRVGVSKGDQPIPDSEVMFNILAPGVMETHYTFGFTTYLSDNSEFTFAAMYAPSVSVSGANPMEAPGQQTISIEMDQTEVQGTYSLRF